MRLGDKFSQRIYHGYEVRELNRCVSMAYSVHAQVRNSRRPRRGGNNSLVGGVYNKREAGGSR